MIQQLKNIIRIDTHIGGCIKKCPCRLWPNCHYYNNSKWATLRKKGDYIQIYDWYDTFFKYKPDMPDATYPNG